MDGMKIADSRAAVRRYERRENHLGWYPELPEDLGRVHALLFDPPGSWTRQVRTRHWLDRRVHEVTFLESAFESEEAACGRRMRVVFPMLFDTEEPDACPQCLDMVNLWVTDREEYDRRVEERTDRWQRQDDERREIAEFMRQQRLRNG